MKKIIRWTWLPTVFGIFGVTSTALGHSFFDPAYWLGLAFGAVAYLGGKVEEMAA